MRRWSLCFMVVALLVVGIGLWLGRSQLLGWYYVHQLARSEDGNRGAWMTRVLDLDVAAVPHLIECLKGNDDRACDNITTALQNLTDRWGLDDSRTTALSIKFADAFPGMSGVGQENVLKLERGWFSSRQNNIRRSQEVLHNAGRLLAESSHVDTPVVRGQALALADRLLAEISPDPMILDACRELARAGLQDAEAATRVHAIRLAQVPGVDLLVEVVPRLRDPSAGVRKAALLAVGPAPDVINDDSLFYWLSDPDPEVRQLCEVALRGRGLQDNHIRIARLMADPRPSVRMEVLEAIEQVPDLDPGVWLRRLSHDPSPAVRTATARAAANQNQVDLSDRINQMAQNDPSPTVQQVARYYLSCHRLPAGQSERH